MASKIINNRVNFGSVKNPMPFPDFLDVQLKSFKDSQRTSLSPTRETISFLSSWITISIRPAIPLMNVLSVVLLIAYL